MPNFGDIYFFDVDRTPTHVTQKFDHIHDLMTGRCVKNSYGDLCPPREESKRWYHKALDPVLDLVARLL